MWVLHWYWCLNFSKKWTDGCRKLIIGEYRHYKRRKLGKKFDIVITDIMIYGFLELGRTEEFDALNFPLLVLSESYLYKVGLICGI